MTEKDDEIIQLRRKVELQRHEIKRLRKVIRDDGEQHASHCHSLSKEHEIRMKAYNSEIERLRSELDKAHKLLSQSIGWQHEAEKTKLLLEKEIENRRNQGVPEK
jgi:hypothetical protein